MTIAGKIDVVVGGQFGDEGKGQVALWMADQHPYAIHVRTGGENAEHRISLIDGSQATFHILPCASKSTNPGVVVLPAGMTFSLAGLARELEQSPPDLQVLVDVNAAIITDELRKSGMDAAKERGSTFIGVGPTMAEKVRRAGNCTTANDVAHKIEQMGAVVLDTGPWMHAALQAGQDILLEASQGTMLALDHGYYPYCTSRNTTAMGALSDAGLNWLNLSDVVMVLKAVPTRVPGNSGPSMGHELTWAQVCAKANRPYEEIHQTREGQGGAGKGAGGVERPFEFSFPEAVRAGNLNGATRTVLTFLDWLDFAASGANRPEQLPTKVLAFVNMVGMQVAPVALARTGPGYHDYIWNGYSPMIQKRPLPNWSSWMKK